MCDTPESLLVGILSLTMTPAEIHQWIMENIQVEERRIPPDPIPNEDIIRIRA